MAIAFKHSAAVRSAWLWLGVRILLVLAACALAGWGVRESVLQRQLDYLSQQSRHRAEFYRLSLESLLSRNGSLPMILAMEERLKRLLRHPAEENARLAANEYLLSIRNGADLNAAFLMDRNGLTLASSNYWLPTAYVGHNYGYRPYFQDALQGRLGTFYGVGATTGEAGFFLSAPVEDDGEIIGAVTVKIDLENFEGALLRSGDPVLLVDSNGVVFLGSVPSWKYHPLTALAPPVLQQLAESRQYDNRLLRPLGVGLPMLGTPQIERVALSAQPAQDYLVQSIKTGPLGWSVVLLSETKQERQNALLAGVVAGFAMALLFSAVIFFQLNVRRYRERRQAEAALRQAHKELERRIAERTADLTTTNAALEEKVEALKTTESILRETRDNAVQAGKLAVLGQMAAGISHEVNQPLTALHTFTDNAVDLLARGRHDDVRENLGFIKQMAERIGRIVGEVKTFTRKPAVERSPVRVTDVLAQALMLVEPRRRKIGAQIDLPANDAGVQALADPQRLEQIIVNLLLNALDAVADPGEKRVAIEVNHANRQVSLCIRDSGPGIPADVLPHLFEPFFTTKVSGQGLGLGLAISRMIAAELGGRLDVCNAAAGGAEFTVILEEA